MPKVKALGINRKEQELTKLFDHALVEKDWTQQHLGKLLHMEDYKISRIINHPMKRCFEDVYAVAEKLGVDIPCRIK